MEILYKIIAPDIRHKLVCLGKHDILHRVSAVLFCLFMISMPPLSSVEDIIEDFFSSPSNSIAYVLEEHIADDDVLHGEPASNPHKSIPDYPAKNLLRSGNNMLYFLKLCQKVPRTNGITPGGAVSIL